MTIPRTNLSSLSTSDSTDIIADNEGPASTEHLDDGDNDKASEQGQNQGDDEAATGVDNTANASGNEQQPLEESAQLTMGIDGVLAEVESLRAVTKITLIFSSDSLDTQQVFGAKIFERIHQ